MAAEKHTDITWAETKTVFVKPGVRCWLTALLLLCVCVLQLLLLVGWNSPPPVAPKTVIPAVESQLPPLTPATIGKLAKSTGFDALVSYAPSGFEPTRLVLEAGQTVRFTNNADHPLRVIAYGSAEADGHCADFDSCETLVAGDFWEFTFQEPGTWDYANAYNAAVMGTIDVR